MTVEIQLNGQRLVAECDPELNPAAGSLLAEFRQCHLRGPALQPGSIIEFGWAPLRIEQYAQDWFVCEPDFLGETLTFLPGVNLVLSVLDMQAAIHRDLGVPPSPTRYDESVLVSDLAWTAPEVLMDHSKTRRHGDSGWYIGPDEGTDAAVDDDNEISIYSVGKLARLKPVWASVMTLPAGYMAIFERDQLAEIYDQDSRLVASYTEKGNE